MNKKKSAPRCLTCKWVTYGKYNRFYGGCPVGCNRPLDAKHGYSKTCGYEEKKEEKKDAGKK